MRVKSNEIIVICGKCGEGKTYIAKKIVKGFKRHIVFDINNEFQAFNRYIPRGTDEDIADFCRKYYKLGNHFVVFDEADLIFNRWGDLPYYTRQLLHLHLHRNNGLLFITRRFASLHNDPIALADHRFIFNLDIEADLKWLKSFMTKEWVSKVPRLKKHWFVHYQRGQSEVCPPI